MNLKKLFLIVLSSGFICFLLFSVWKGTTTSPFSIEGFSTWLGAFFTLAIMSFLYKDNPLYRFAEHLFVGVSAAYYMVIGIWTTLLPNCIGKLFPLGNFLQKEPAENFKPDYLLFIPLILGSFLLLKFSRKFGYFSKVTISFILGLTAGLGFVRYLTADFMGQIRNTLLPLFVLKDGGLDFYTSFSNCIIVTGVLSTLVYFFYSVEQNKGLKRISGVGRIFLMITFGAAFGNTIMGRISLLIGRMEFLLKDWLGLIQ